MPVATRNGGMDMALRTGKMPEVSRDRTEVSLRRLAPLLLVATGALAGVALFGDSLSFETLRANRDTLIAWRDAHYGLVALGFMAAYVAVVAFSLPGGAVMTLTGGFLFGLVAGASMTVLAATIGATAIFLAARHGLGDALHARLKARGGEGVLGRMERGLQENAVSYLLLIRLVPVIPFFVANLAPAFLGVRLRTFVLTTFFGIIPGSLVYTWIGVGLGEVFDAGDTPDLGIVFEPAILGPILGLAALAALPIGIRAVRGRKGDLP